MTNQSPPSPSAILILLTRDDAETFLAKPIKINRIVCLTPAAWAVMDKAGWSVETSYTQYGSTGHQRGLVRSRRIDRYLDDVFSNTPELHAGVQDAIRQSLLQYTAVVSRIWCTVGTEGPWLVLSDGNFERTSDRWGITSLLLRRIRRNFYFVGNGAEKTVINSRLSLLSFLNRCTAQLLGHSGSILIVKPERGMKGFSAEAASISKGTIIWTVIVAKRGARTYRRTIRNLFALLARFFGRELTDAIQMEIPLLRSDLGTDSAIRAVLKGIPDPLIQRAANDFGEDFVSYFLKIDSLSDQFARCLKFANPRFAVLWIIGSRVMPALAWALRESKIPCWSLAAASISGGHIDTTSRYAAELVARYTGVSRLTKGNIVQSPAAFLAVQDSAPEHLLIRSQPIVWMGRDWQAQSSVVRKSERRERVILFLGNFSCWHDDRPWVWETADEIAQTIAILARETANIDRCRLIIRSKSKPDMDIDTMRYLVRDFEHCEIQASRDIMQDSNIPSLKDSIANADMAVGFFSTSLEEAVHAGCPVLLWGGRQRYQHLKASYSLPVRNHRSAVYSVKRTEDLRPMIESMLAAHENSRLTDDEVREHCWPQTEPDVSSLAQMLFSDSARAR